MEEEYFVVDRRTAGVKCEPPGAFMASAKRKIGQQLMTEILQSQVEVATAPATSARDARAELTWFRSILAEVGREHGVGIVAAGTHPLAHPQQQRMTKKRRYTKVIDDLGMVGLGSPLCGLHVHVEVPEPDLRVEIMHRLVPFLPLLLALSTSSPFWAGYDTCLLGYRNAVNDAMPRTGFPEMFHNLSEYENYVGALVQAKIIPDPTYIWWALRPSLKHPTLELRVTDCCTSVEDAVAIASLYRALVQHVTRHREVNGEFCAVVRALSEENRWRAQRYGIDGTYLDIATNQARPFKELLDDTVALVGDEIADLAIEPEIESLRKILKRGTSAHLQLELYRTLLKFGRPKRQALRDVTRWLRASTEAGDFVASRAGPAAAETGGASASMAEGSQHAVAALV
jgi:glutamate---cysteine ligase / carboxylate-amine ligase